MIDRIIGAADINDVVVLFVALEAEEDFVAVSGLNFGFLEYLVSQYFSLLSEDKVVLSQK